ncbi:hypothetical protein MLD38_008552 [Melastoma candidum]|uniref:Uncharacterized protein n=1 Tax=Melastoma candidum TaxID=119954 RepID=A0ACB9RV87_9MYRT|nr:hypothetical protein MLD38_008552 [Melastoma candidum]
MGWDLFEAGALLDFFHEVFGDAREDMAIGVVILTGMGTKAFCSGGDQALRMKEGYADPGDAANLNLLDLQALLELTQMRVAGYAVGGGNVLHMVGSFDAVYGSSIMSRLIGPKKARKMWYLARFYSASEADKMGLVTTVVPLESLEQETVKWCREILRNSPTAIRMLKSALNAIDDGHARLQATFLAILLFPDIAVLDAC